MRDEWLPQFKPVDFRAAAQKIRDDYYAKPFVDPVIYLPVWRKPRWWEFRRQRRERQLQRMIESYSLNVKLLRCSSKGFVDG